MANSVSYRRAVMALADLPDPLSTLGDGWIKAKYSLMRRGGHAHARVAPAKPANCSRRSAKASLTFATAGLSVGCSLLSYQGLGEQTEFVREALSPHRPCSTWGVDCGAAVRPGHVWKLEVALDGDLLQPTGAAAEGGALSAAGYR